MLREIECTLELLTENGERERGWWIEDEVVNGDLIGRALDSKGDLFLFIMRSSEHSFLSEDVCVSWYWVMSYLFLSIASIDISFCRSFFLDFFFSLDIMLDVCLVKLILLDLNL